MNQKVLTLLQLQQTVAALVQRPETQNVWVTAEILDVAVRGGHCYMELLQKDERGLQVAKARGVIWASSFGRIDAEFFAATGQRFASGLKVMLRVSASMHPVYGFSLVVSAVNPEYTMGDLLRRRREILMRLKEESFSIYGGMYILSAYQIHKFFPSFSLIECSGKIGSCSYRVLFFYSSHLHTHVFGFYHNHYS